jgi:hypothetical protein
MGYPILVQSSYHQNLLALAGVMFASVRTVEEFSIEELHSDHSKNELNTCVCVMWKKGANFLLLYNKRSQFFYYKATENTRRAVIKIENKTMTPPGLQVIRDTMRSQVRIILLFGL